VSYERPVLVRSDYEAGDCLSRNCEPKVDAEVGCAFPESDSVAAEAASGAGAEAEARNSEPVGRTERVGLVAGTQEGFAR